MSERPLSEAKVARLLGRSVHWFRAHRADLAAAGFPARDELLGGWHEQAVKIWLAGRISGSVPGTRPRDRAEQWAKSA